VLLCLGLLHQSLRWRNVPKKSVPKMSQKSFPRKSSKKMFQR
jgi:hypothetical protein